MRGERVTKIIMMFPMFLYTECSESGYSSLRAASVVVGSRELESTDRPVQTLPPRQPAPGRSSRPGTHLGLPNYRHSSSCWSSSPPDFPPPCSSSPPNLPQVFSSQVLHQSFHQFMFLLSTSLFISPIFLVSTSLSTILLNIFRSLLSYETPTNLCLSPPIKQTLEYSFSASYQPDLP